MPVDLKKVDLRLAVSDDIPPGDLPVKIRCMEPDHNDPGASMAVYPDHVTCYGCGFSVARRAEALAYLLRVRMPQTGGEWAAFINQQANRYTVESLDNYREKSKAEAEGKPLPMGLAAGYSRILLTIKKDRLEWLYARGLTDTTIAEAGLGHDLYSFTIPVFGKNGELLTIRYRNDEHESGEYESDGRPIPKYRGYRGRNGTYLYGAETIKDAEQVVVCEGELDALRLRQEGFAAVSPTNGVRQLVYVPRMIKEQIPEVQKIIICTDMDGPGLEGGRSLAQAADEVGLWWKQWLWGLAGGKDITEYLESGGSLDWLR
jgi:hypothetical protein